MADDVGIAADRRREVAVVRGLQPGVAEIARVVVGLLERAQHEAGQRPAAAALGRDPLVEELRGLAHDLGRLLGRHVPARARRGRARRARPAARPGAPPRCRRDARGRGTGWDCAGAPGTQPPARWRRSSGARSGGGTRSARTAVMADNMAIGVEVELRLGGLDRDGGPGRRAAPPGRPRPRARPPATRPTAPALAPRRRRCGRRGRSPGARRSGSPRGRTTTRSTRSPLMHHLRR